MDSPPLTLYFPIFQHSIIPTLLFPTFLFLIFIPKVRMGSNRNNYSSGLGFASKVGVEMAVSVCIGSYGGHLVDQYLGTEPWLMLLGLILGMAAGFLSIYTAFQAMDDGNDKEDQPPKP